MPCVTRKANRDDGWYDDVAIPSTDFIVRATSLQRASHWPLTSSSWLCGWFNRLLVTQEFGMAVVLLLCPSWATSCYCSAPTRLSTHRSLQGVGYASKHPDRKRHGRHTNIRKHTQTELSLSSEQQADISLLITVPVPVCVCVCERDPACRICCAWPWLFILEARN